MKRSGTIFLVLITLGIAGFLGYRWLTSAGQATATEQS